MENGPNLSLREHLEWPDPKGFWARLEKILSQGSVSDDDLKTLKLVADPNSLPDSMNWSTPRTPLQDFLFRHRELQSEARIALVLLGLGSESEVISFVTQAALKCVDGVKPGLYWLPVRDFLLFMALSEESATSHIRLLLDRPNLWAFNLACRLRLPESHGNGDYKLIDSFRRWMINAPMPNDGRNENWRNWQQFASCLTMSGFRQQYFSKARWCGAPTAFHESPLVVWAFEHNHVDWLVQEFTQGRTLDGMRDLLERFVKLGLPVGTKFCCEQLRKARYEDNTQFDMIHNVLRFHPRPLPTFALDACVEALRHPSHPAKFQHRIDTLELLVDGADQGTYQKGKVAALILQLAQEEVDPDVRIAAIDLIPWASPAQPEKNLSSAISHVSSRIREAAERALSKCHIG